MSNVERDAGCLDPPTCLVDIVSRPSSGDKRGEPRNGFRIMPCHDIKYRVGARDKEQLHVIWIIRAKRSERIGRVGGSVAESISKRLAIKSAFAAVASTVIA